MRDKELTLEVTSKCTVGCKWCSSSGSKGSKTLEEFLEYLKEIKIYAVSSNSPDELVGACPNDIPAELSLSTD